MKKKRMVLLIILLVMVMGFGVGCGKVNIDKTLSELDLESYKSYLEIHDVYIEEIDDGSWSVKQATQSENEWFSTSTK